MGRLLRALRDDARPRALPERLNLTSAPRYPLRGHQLGYRPKTNSYDAWDLAQWERYIRELAVFGTNAIELIPPRSDDAADSPHFPLPPLEMMAGMSRICADYGLDVWIWYPAMDRDYADPETVDICAQGVGRGLRQAAADRRGLRARGRPRAIPVPKCCWHFWKSRPPTCGGFIPKLRCGSRRRAFRESGWTSSWPCCEQSPPGSAALCSVRKCA